MPTARTSFSAPGRFIVTGQHVADDDPIIQGREHLFDGVTAVRPKKAAAKKAAAKSDD